MTTPQSLEKFLGSVDHTRGPLGLLGIDPDRCNEAEIVASLHARLARVAAHPQNRTPEADQIRLALHAAAAQLMDPALRQKVLKTFHGEEDAFDPLAEEGEKGEVAPRAGVSEQVDPALLRDTRILLGAFGGLNPASHRRLTMLAQARGVAPDQMQKVLSSLTPASGGSGSSLGDAAREQTLGAPRGISQHERPLTDQIDPGYLVLDRMIKFGLVFILALGLVGGAIYLLVRKGGTAPAPAPVAVSGTEMKPKVNESPTGLFSSSKPVARSDTPATGDATQGVEAIASLRTLTGRSDTDAKALMSQLDIVARTWFELAPDQAASLQDTVVEGMYRLALPESLAVVDALVDRAAWMKDPALIPSESQVSDAVLACGLLTRLAKEESFPPQVLRQIDSAIAGLFERGKRTDERTFQSGAQASLYAAAERLASRWGDAAASANLAGSWARWGKVARAAGGSNRQRVVLLTLEGMLTSAPDPTQNKAVYDAIGELAASLDISGDAEARNWILRWLVAPGIDAEHLFALTSRLAENPQHSGGIDHTLVVPTSATERTRTELRERYAKVWGVGDLAEGDRVRSAWIVVAKRELRAIPTGNDAAVRVAHLMNWAKLNDAASLLWSGNQQDASNAIDGVVAVSVTPPTAGAPITSYTVDFSGTDGNFSARYFSVAPAERTKLVQEAFKSEEIGPRDAAIVTAEFIRNGSTSTRAALKELIKRRSRDRFMLRALLDYSSLFPRTREVSELIEGITGGKLPAPDETVWRIELRRALLESNLAQIARTKEFGTLDSDAELLALGYWQRLGVQSVAGIPPDRVALRLAERWRQQARVLIPTGREGWTIDQIERKLASRRAQARGIVQRFAAEQFGLVELLAYTIANESPSRTTDVKKLVDAGEKEVASQSTVLAQIEILERMLTQLWQIRFEDQDGVHPT